MIRYLRLAGTSAVTSNWCALTVAVALSAGLTAQQDLAENRRPEIYETAAVDAQGRLVITTSEKRTIVVGWDREQTSFADPVMSSDRTAVGAQGRFPNCCTSYDLPLQLVVYSRGHVHRFKGNGLPIFNWHFADSGTRVAFGQEPAHFGCEIHYELREIHSERLIAAADIPQPCGEVPKPRTVEIPTWVSALTSRRK